MRSVDIIRLWIATLLLYVATGLVYPIFSLYMAYRGLSHYQIGVVASIATLTSIIPIVLIGWYSDIVNREIVQGAIGLSIIPLILIYTRLKSMIDFMMVHPLYFTLSYSYMTLSGAIAMDYIRTQRGLGFGRFRTSGSIGWMIGTFVGGWIVEKWGFLTVFYISPIFFLISALLFGIGGFRRKTMSRSRELGRKPYVKAFKEIITNRAIYPLMLAISIAWLTTPVYYTFLPLYMTESLRASQLLSSLAFTVTPIGEIPAMIYLGALSDRIGRRKVIALCLSAYPLRYILTISMKNPILVALVQLLHGLTFGGLYVVSIAYLSDSVSENLKGLVLSTYTVVMNISSFIGNYLMGYILESYGFKVMYLSAAIISSLSVPILIMSRRRLK